MSSQTIRIQRSRRIAQTQKIARRRAAQADRHLEVRRPAGYFKKHRPMDCGNPQCLLCHPEKALSIEKAKYRHRGAHWEEV